MTDVRVTTERIRCFFSLHAGITFRMVSHASSIRIIFSFFALRLQNNYFLRAQWLSIPVTFIGVRHCDHAKNIGASMALIARNYKASFTSVIKIIRVRVLVMAQRRLGDKFLSVNIAVLGFCNVNFVVNLTTPLEETALRWPLHIYVWSGISRRNFD